MSQEAYLLDTSIASVAVDGGNSHHASVRAHLASLGSAALYISVFTIGEIEYGLGVAPAIDPPRHKAVRDALKGYELLPVDHHTGEEFARIRAAIFQQFAPTDRKGRLTKKRVEDLTERTTARELGIQENDLWIVSVAVQYDVRFLTLDRAAGMHRVVAAAGHLAKTDFFGAP